MNNNNIAVKSRDIGKCYRIGVKNDMYDNFGSTIFNFIKSPIKNYKKYRSLYKFNNITPENSQDQSDIVWALKNISFEIKRGEVVGIIGRNGAGKSTLLKILSNITSPTVGFCTIYGDISSLLEVGTGFHPELTGRENVYLNGTILGMTKKEKDRKFDEIVDFSGVERYLETPVKRYSSGMKVRLAFSVAAHLEPEILIIDEVLAVGDAAFQKKCLNKMQDVGKQGRTVLFVSHNMSAITRLCKRSILLEAGNVIDDGPTSDIISSYLHSCQNTPAQYTWDYKDAPSSDIVRLVSVKICNAKNEVSSVINIDQQIIVKMEYEVTKSGYSLLPHFILNNQDGVCIFIGLDQDPEWQGKLRPKGKYISTAQIQGNLLAEGTFFIGPVMRTVEPDILHFVEIDAIAFEIINTNSKNTARGEWTKEIAGIIRPLLKWSTHFKE
jgi:lipopolysaccharide transport system ATP-binding protein